MRIHERLRFSHAFSGASLGVLALLLALSTPPSIAQSGLAGGQQGRPLRPDDTAASGDEGIGSLPVMEAPTPTTPYGKLVPGRLLGPQGQVRPFITLSGRIDLIRDIVLAARGDGVVTLHPMDVLESGQDESETHWVVGFHGDVEIDLGSRRLQEIDAAIRIGTEFSGGVAAACWNGYCTPPVVLDIQAMNLDLATYVQSGSLMIDSVQVLALSAQQTMALISVSELGRSSIRLTQSIK